MRTNRLPPPRRPDHARHAAALRRGVDVSRVLMLSRAVDLSGLDDHVGRLCATLLDLPAGETEPLRQSLQELLRAIELAIDQCATARSS